MGSATRIISAIVTGGGSELARATVQGAKKIPGVKDVTNPVDKALSGVGLDTASLSSPLNAASKIAQGAVDTASPAADAVVTKPGQTDAERERDARLAADKRKKDYQNMGRSSTILTGPGGLAGSGSGTAKTLLGA